MWTQQEQGTPSNFTPKCDLTPPGGTKWQTVVHISQELGGECPLLPFTLEDFHKSSVYTNCITITYCFSSCYHLLTIVVPDRELLFLINLGANYRLLTTTRYFWPITNINIFHIIPATDVNNRLPTSLVNNERLLMIGIPNCRLLMGSEQLLSLYTKKQ